MGEPIIIYGKSGSGKTTSLENFAENEIYLINNEDKRLPFKKKFTYMSGKKGIGQTMAALSKMPTKTAVIDDAGYFMTDMFMSRHREKGGSSTYDLYNDIADGMNALVNHIKKGLPEDVIVYLMFHQEKGEDGEMKLLTIGKLLDQKVCLEGKVTICLHCIARNGEHYFETNSDGSTIAKSPRGMFEQEIPNDLKFVDDTVRNFYEIQTEFTKEVNNAE